VTRHQFVDPPQTWTACVAVHAKDPERQRQATHGLLCAGHHADLEQQLAEIPALLSEVEKALVRSSGTGPKVTGTKEQPLPYATDRDGNSPQADALRGTHALLVSWVLLVLEEHPDRLHAPADQSGAMSRFLMTHLGWCEAQPWTDDLLDELRDNARTLRRAARPERTHWKTLGVCDLHHACDLATHDEIEPCTGTLRAKVSSEDDGPPAAIECTECGAKHMPETWRALARRLRKDDSWLTAAQLSELLRVPIGTIWRWASEDDWRRLDRRPKRYHHDDAQASYDNHRLEEAS
jgi:hypothetical protein